MCLRSMHVTFSLERVPLGPRTLLEIIYLAKNMHSYALEQFMAH